MTQNPLETARLAFADSNSMAQRAVSRLRKNGFDESVTLDLKPQQTHTLEAKSTRVPLGHHAFELEIGNQRVHIYPDFGIQSKDAETTDLIVLDPDRYFSQISNYQRLRKNRTIEVRYKENGQASQSMIPFRNNTFCVKIQHEGGSLTFTCSGTTTQAKLTLLPQSSGIKSAINHRQQALDRVATIFGGPIEILPPIDGMDLLQSVNDQMGSSRNQRTASDGSPGGVVELPESITPIIIGDLHTRIDNLLKVLSESAVINDLDNGTTALVFLGDAVHEEDRNSHASMDTSLLIMDLILKLKLKYPNQTYYLLGNHDSFSEEVTKGGVPQGLLWAEHLKATRGEAYFQEFQRFYRLSPRVVLSNDFVACHAGPPRARVTKEQLINLRDHPQIAEDIVWTRMKTPASPSGYGRPEVRRFRKALRLEKNTPFIVAHTPFAPDSTVWHNIGRIPHHHVVYSARPDKVGIFMRVDGQIVSQVYSTEPLLEWVNQRARSTKQHTPEQPNSCPTSCVNNHLGSQLPE